MKSRNALVFTLACALAISACGGKSASITPEEARAIAKEAYIYASPMVDAYGIMHTYFMAPGNPEYKGAMNQVISEARVYTPAVTAAAALVAAVPPLLFGQPFWGQRLCSTAKDAPAQVHIVEAPLLKDREALGDVQAELVGKDG